MTAVTSWWYRHVMPSNVVTVYYVMAFRCAASHRFVWRHEVLWNEYGHDTVDMVTSHEDTAASHSIKIRSKHAEALSDVTLTVAWPEYDHGTVDMVTSHEDTATSYSQDHVSKHAEEFSRWLIPGTRCRICIWWSQGIYCIGLHALYYSYDHLRMIPRAFSTCFYESWQHAHTYIVNCVMLRWPAPLPPEKKKAATTTIKRKVRQNLVPRKESPWERDCAQGETCMSPRPCGRFPEHGSIDWVSNFLPFELKKSFPTTPGTSPTSIKMT